MPVPELKTISCQNYAVIVFFGKFWHDSRTFQTIQQEQSSMACNNVQNIRKLSLESELYNHHSPSDLLFSISYLCVVERLTMSLTIVYSNYGPVERALASISVRVAKLLTPPI